MNAVTPRGMVHQLGAHRRPYYGETTQQSNVKIHKAEGILKGESLDIGVLYVGGRHGNAVERATMPRRAEYSCSSGIYFFAF